MSLEDGLLKEEASLVVPGKSRWMAEKKKKKIKNKLSSNISEACTRRIISRACKVLLPRP